MFIIYFSFLYTVFLYAEIEKSNGWRGELLDFRNGGANVLIWGLKVRVGEIIQDFMSAENCKIKGL